MSTLRNSLHNPPSTPEVLGSGWHSCRSTAPNIVPQCFILPGTTRSGATALSELSWKGGANSQMTVHPFFIFRHLMWVKISKGSRRKRSSSQLFVATRTFQLFRGNLWALPDQMGDRNPLQHVLTPQLGESLPLFFFRSS